MKAPNDKIVVRISLPGKPASANELRRKYRHPFAYKKLRESLQRNIYYRIQAQDRSWLEAMCAAGKRMRVVVEFRHSRYYDRDNSHAACKPIFDAMKNLHFLADDDEPHMDAIVLQEKCLRQNAETVISIAEAGE